MRLSLHASFCIEPDVTRGRSFPKPPRFARGWLDRRLPTADRRHQDDKRGVHLGRPFSPRTQLRGDAAKLLQCKLQIHHDLCGDLIGWRQAVGVGRARVLQPEDVEVELVALGELLILELAEAFAGLSLVTVVLAAVARDEVVEVCALQRSLAQREALVGAQVIDPQSASVSTRSLGDARSKNSTLAFTPCE